MQNNNNNNSMCRRIALHHSGQQPNYRQPLHDLSGSYSVLKGEKLSSGVMKDDVPNVSQHYY